MFKGRVPLYGIPDDNGNVLEHCGIFELKLGLRQDLRVEYSQGRPLADVGFVLTSSRGVIKSQDVVMIICISNKEVD